MKRLDDGFVSTNIFESNAQWVGLQNVDLSKCKLLWDRCLIRDCTDDNRLGERIGAIWIPESARDGKQGPRIGEVIAVGPGERFHEKMQFGVVKYTPYPDGPSPMSVKPGDKVLYDRRREAEVEIRGQMYSLVYETQSVLAILDSATVVQPGQFGEQTQSGNWIEHPAVQTGQGR